LTKSARWGKGNRRSQTREQNYRGNENPTHHFQKDAAGLFLLKIRLRKEGNYNGWNSQGKIPDE
jgi:hypothetical protein